MKPSTNIARCQHLPPDGQRAALSVTALREDLCDNPARLADDVWENLVNSKFPIDNAKLLAAKADTADRLAHLIDVERRASVIATALAVCPVTADQAEKLLAGKGAKAIATAIDNRWQDHPDERIDSLVVRIAEIIGGPQYLELIGADPGHSDDDVAGVLARLHDIVTRPSRRRNEALKAILAVRPALTERYVSLGEDVPELLQAAAGSSLLAGRVELQHRIVATINDDPDKHMWTTRGFVYNPFVALDALDALDRKAIGYESVRGIEWRTACGRGHIGVPIRDIVDTGHLEWVTRRSLPGTTFNGDLKPGRPFDLVELLHNPNLGQEHRDRVIEALRGWDIRSTLEMYHIDVDDLTDTHEGTEDIAPADDSWWTPPADTADLNPDVDENVSGWKVSQLVQYVNVIAALPWIASQLDSIEQWTLLFGLIDDMRDQTLIDAVETVKLVM